MPIATVTNQLTQKRNNRLSTVQIFRRQVTLVAENHQNLVLKCRSQHIALILALNLAVLLERFEKEFGARSRREIQRHHLVLWIRTQHRRQRHRLSRARRTTQNHRLQIIQPCTKHRLVTNRVNGINHHRRILDFLRLKFWIVDAITPWLPRLILDTHLIVDEDFAIRHLNIRIHIATNVDHFLAKLVAQLQLHWTTKRPQHGKNQIFTKIRALLILVERIFRVFIVLQNVGQTTTQLRKQRKNSLRARKRHHVFGFLGPFQDL
mmetsp:Transcript_32739/g.53135  ORF Transcript_32739/g.53135 Transcript_32739/m.53135 type:complete len:264 (-) Transcript_32739:223-1014(-)